MEDIRNEILSSVADRKVTASIIADDDGIISGSDAAKNEAETLGVSLEKIIEEGSQIKKGEVIVRFHGIPKQAVMAEEVLIGLLAKSSGIATAAHKFVQAAGPRPKIVCGAWKKMPPSLKEVIRSAIVAGGAFCRISQEPFVYLDKNYINLLGGIKDSLQAVKNLNGYIKVVQLKNREKDVVLEAGEAIEYGAGILFIDTGNKNDVKRVVEQVCRLGWREKVKIAFGGGVRLEDMDELKTLDIDILDIGRSIVDAPLLDMRLEVIDHEDIHYKN